MKNRPVIPANPAQSRKHPHWMPAFVGMTLAFGAFASDGLLPKKSGEPDFLPVDQAFQLGPLESDTGRLEASWQIAKGYYLYRGRLKFTLTAPSGAKLGAPDLPAGEKHYDEHFGTTEIYRGTLRAALPVSGGGKGPYRLTVVYQGCADAGLCYPPQTRTLELDR